MDATSLLLASARYSAELAASTAFTALIWWLVPLAGVLGAFGYILWISRYKGKFEKGTSRSVNQFERFQNSFRNGHEKK
jgi:nitrate reductase NapE component